MTENLTITVQFGHIHSLTIVLLSTWIFIEQLKIGDYTCIEGIGRLIVCNGDPERYVTFISLAMPLTNI